MTADALKDCNKRHLAQLAKEKGITGWHAMRKDQLIRALSLARSAPSKSKKQRRIAADGRRSPQETGQGRVAVRQRRRATAVPLAAFPSDHDPSKHWIMLARKTASSF